MGEVDRLVSVVAGVLGELLSVPGGVDGSDDPFGELGPIERPNPEGPLDGLVVTGDQFDRDQFDRDRFDRGQFDRAGLYGPHGNIEAELRFCDCCDRAAPLPFTAPPPLARF